MKMQAKETYLSQSLEAYDFAFKAVAKLFFGILSS
jgi:hypothetical protein